jgi:hypothetical protein
MAATFAHELAHAVTHDACVEKPLDFYEVVAESVAYAVCSRFGLDLSLRSVDYVAGWGTRTAMTWRRSEWAWPPIHDGAASLLDAIEAAMTDTSERDLAA